MIKRVIEISVACNLSVKNRQLVLKTQKSQQTAPIEDLGAVIIDTPMVNMSQPALVSLAQENVSVILCDQQHLPSAVLLPMYGHHLHGKIVKAQAMVKEPVRKRLWQSIVRHKIHEQSLCLERIGEMKYARRLQGMIKTVLSGDTSLVEAQAARIYFKALFGRNFHRNDANLLENPLLNYGYSLMRSLCLRACVAAGLTPALSLCHKNQYNPYALGDDLMEICRPLVDFHVYNMKELDLIEEISPRTKTQILEIMIWRAKWHQAETSLLVAIQKYAQSLTKVILGEQKEIEFPEIL